MYKPVTLLATLFFILSVHAQIRSSSDMIGRWEHNDFKLEFFRDGRLALTMQGGTLTGASYTIDFQHTPAVIHIIIPAERGKLSYNAYLKFKSKNEVELEWFKDNDYYSRNSQPIILKKVTM